MKFFKLTGMLLLAGLTLLAYSCTKDSPVNPDDQLAFRKNATVPFHATTYNTPVVVDDGSTTGILIADIPGEGNGTHLGNFDFFLYSEIFVYNDLDPDPNEYLWVQTGDITFTAANGDQLFGTIAGYTNDLDPPEDHGGWGDWEITSGNGRFEGYTGSGTYSYTLSAEFVATLVFDGTLTKP